MVCLLFYTERHSNRLTVINPSNFLGSLQKGNIELGYKDSYPKLLEMGLVSEDSYFGYVLSARYLLYKPHVKTIAQSYDLAHIQIVYYVIRRNGQASMSDFVDAFNGILTQKQVRNLIEGLCKTPLVASHGNARATRYKWVN